VGTGGEKSYRSSCQWGFTDFSKKRIVGAGDGGETIDKRGHVGIGETRYEKKTLLPWRGGDDHEVIRSGGG